MHTHLFLTCQNAQGTGLTVHWDAWDVPHTHISLPALVNAQLLDIRREHAAWAYDLGKTCLAGKQIAEHFTIHETLSMWWCSLLYERHPKMTPCLYTLFRLRALEKLMEQENITACETDIQDQDLLEVLASFCAKSGIGFTGPSKHLRAHKKDSLKKRLYTALPGPLRALLRLGHWLLTVKRLFPRAKLAQQADCASVVTYFPNIDLEQAKSGRFVSHYWENFHKLLAQNKVPVRWLFIRFPSPQLDLKACLRLTKTFADTGCDGVSFHYLEEFLSGTDILKALWRYVRLATTSLRFEKSVLAHAHFSASHMNFAKLIHADYVESFRGWRCLERCLMAQAFAHYVEEAGPMRWTIFPLENCPWERMLSYEIARRNYGPVYGVQHLTIRPTDLRYFDDPRIFADTSVPSPTLLCPNGKSAEEQWQESGVPSQRLKLVEALRYGYLEEARHMELPQSPQKTLMVLTSFFADETEAHLKLFAEAYAAGLFAGLNCLIKPHPYLDPKPFLPAEIVAQIHIGTEPLKHYWQKNILVWASNSTTAALEAAILGLPVACMRPSHDFDLSPIQNIPHLVRTASLEDVRTMLRDTVPLTIPKDYLLLDPNLPRLASLLFP